MTTVTTKVSHHDGDSPFIAQLDKEKEDLKKTKDVYGCLRDDSEYHYNTNLIYNLSKNYSMTTTDNLSDDLMSLKLQSEEEMSLRQLRLVGRMGQPMDKLSCLERWMSWPRPSLSGR